MTNFSTESSQGNLTPAIALQVLAKHKKLIFIVMLLALLAGIYVLIQPNDYLGTGQLEIRPGASRKFDLTQMALGSDDADEKLGTDVQVLQSRTLALSVVKQLHLESNADFFGVRQLKKKYTLDDPRDRETVAKRFGKTVTVDRLPKTDVIVISANTRSPQLSAQIVNALMNQYIDHLFETRFASTQRAANWLTGQIDDLKQQVESDQTRLVELQKKLGLVGIDQTHNLAATAVEGLTQAETQASIERIVAEARYRILSETDPALIEGGAAMLSERAGQTGGVSLLSSLRATQATLTSQLAQLRTQFGPNYQEVKQTQAQLDATSKAIASEEERILNEAKVNYEAARNNEDLTSTRLKDQRATAFAQHDDIVAYNLLQQDYASHRALYQGLIQRLREAGITSGLESSELDIIDLADIPVTPSGRNHWLKLFGCIFFGFILACILAGIMEALDSTVQDVTMVENLTGLANFGVIPQMSLKSERSPADTANIASSGPNLAILAYPLSQFSEAIRVFRTGLLLSLPTRRQRVVVFTSSAPAEGKSTISSNLAAAIALGNERVLLIDADMRKPTLYRRFHVSNAKGLSTCLSGQASWRGLVQPIVACPNLHLLTSGPIPVLPAELLASTAMAEMIEQASLEYDVVIIDAPPAGNLADSSLLGQIAGTTIFVVRYGTANRRHLARAVQQAQRNGANPKGFVLNGISQNSVDYYDYYTTGGYSYAYGQQPKGGEASDDI